MRRITIKISSEVDDKLQDIIKKQGKNQTEIINELILNYDIYKKYMENIYDELQIIKLFLEDLTDETFEDNYELVKLKPKKKIYPNAKKNCNYNLAYYHILKEMAEYKNIPASNLLDELIKEAYYQSNDKSLMYKVLDETKIIYLVLKDHITNSKVKSIRQGYLAKKYRGDLKN